MQLACLYSSFGMKYGFDYSMEYFKKMFMENEIITINASKEWSNEGEAKMKNGKK